MYLRPFQGDVVHLYTYYSTVYSTGSKMYILISWHSHNSKYEQKARTEVFRHSMAEVYIRSGYVTSK